MTANRDIMSVALAAVYGPDNNLADWEAQHWVAEGFEPCGPGDKAAWYAAEGASGSSYGDLEYDYWTNVYAGGGGTPPSNTVAPLLSGSTAALGNSVSTGNGTWTGDATITFTYQWQVSATGVGGWSNIASLSTSSSFTITASEQGKYIRCVVTGTNGAGNSSANSDVCAVESAGLTLLKTATLWLDASDTHAASGVQYLRNKGTGGRALDARFGSTGQAQIIGGALKLPGVSGNTATVPWFDSSLAAMDVRVRVAFNDWTPSSATTIFTRSGGVGDRYFTFVLNPDGTLTTNFCNVPSQATAAFTVSDGSFLWIRATWTSGTVKIYQAPDSDTMPSSWTQVGTDVVGGSITQTGTSAVTTIAGSNNAVPFTVKRAWISTTIDGAAALDADFTAQSTLATSFTESSANAATVTINSTSGVDSNDPLLLTHSGTNYLYLPGITGNYATTPDSAALGITGDIDLRCRVALDDWTPATDMGFITKDSSTREYAFGINASGGTLYLYWWNSGATFTQVNSSTAPTAADGDALDVRVTLDVDNGASGRDVKFWTKSTSTPLSDNAGWTQLGTTSTAAGVSSIRDTTDTVGIGGRSGGNFNAGKFYRAMILNGIGGTIALDADFTANTNQSSFTESSANAATVTINRATSGRKAVMVVRPTLLFGTDDYLEVPDNDLLDFASSDNFTLLAVVRQFSDTAYGYIVEKRATALTDRFRGYEMNVTATDVRGFVFGATLDGDIDGSKGTAATKAYTLGSLTCMTVVRDTGADQLKAGAGSSFGTAVTDASVNGLANSSTLRVGVSGSAGYYYMNGEISHVAIFRSALTTTDIGNIMSYLGVS